MWNQAVLLLALSGTVLGASIFSCPEETVCPEQGTIESTSFQFLDKLGTKHSRAVVKLTVANASLDKVPPELKYLKSLKYLDLSHNNIQISSIPSLPKLKTLKLIDNNLKSISLTLLPKNIEELDLSNNLLSRIPQDCNELKSLKILHLYKNLIDCDCYNYNVLTYKKLIKDGILIPEPVICHFPKQFAGKDINSINCTLNDIMLYDEPEEGSGIDNDIFTETTKAVVPHLNEEDEVEGNDFIDDKDELPKEDTDLLLANDMTTTTIEPEEGSGDLEGSGFAIEMPDIPACHINCSTPEPIGSNDDNDTAPMPGPTDQLKIFAEDVLHPIFMEPTEPPTTTTSTTTTETPITTPSTTTTPKEVIEEMIKKVVNKEVDKEIFRESDKSTDVEIILNNTKTGEMEKATALSQNNSAVYVVVVCIILIAIVFLVCLIKKRRAKRLNRNRREIPAGLGEEMKPLEKPAPPPINDKNNHREYLPFVNGQNGKPKDDSVLKSFIPLEHPENASDTELDEPELRDKPELLTPTTERVTIRASEIPDSIPKTPVVVHRQKNSEGEIVTTVVPP